ncbi:copper resistance protein CopC [Candidatus Poriferisodalis sp.]|uniref:copper resistance protein CopC n=1 Tax=Candidatus Poriferisodalis sp. TaxID=3101277 RepID=UPI003B02C0F2
MLALAFGAALALVIQAPAAAHTGLDTSQPADGETADDPVSQISLTFNRPVEPAGSGVAVFDEHGDERRPASLNSADRQTWLLNFEPPLSGGQFEVSWRVVAEDGHVVEGSFGFTVAGSPDPSAASTGEASNASDREFPDETADSAEGVRSAGDGASASSTGSARDDDPRPPTMTVADPPSVPDTAENAFSTTSMTNAAAEDLGGAERTATSQALHRSSGATGAQRFADSMRVLGLLATLIIVGGFAFMAFVVRDEPLERARLRAWVRYGGLLLGASAIVAVLTQAAIVNDDWSAIWTVDAITGVLGTQFGLAACLRLVGGLAVFTASRHEAPHPDRSVLAAVGIVGAVGIVAAYSLDGHTVTEGPRWLHTVANLAHVSAAGVWSGGLVMLASVVRRRRRSREVIRYLVRFSQLASVSFVLAGVAGTVMAVLVMDQLSDLWSSAWGRLLLAKIALVAVAAALGMRNRWVHMPVAARIAAQSAEDPVHERLFRTVATEAVLLGCVGVVTAFLVGASVL